jgi:galactokinase
MAINRETLLAAAGRDDDLVTLHNRRPRRFPDRRFRIVDLLRDASWSDWMDFVDSSAVKQVLEAAPGDWSHYARAPLLRLQHESPGAGLRGMDCLVDGNVPIGAGLSSSSSLVVAFAEAAVALNGLDVAIRDFVDLCGEGEWFVGSRGGSSDHAAIRVSQAGAVSRIGFFPFRLCGQVPFPSDLRLVIAHSGAGAVKSAAAKHTFNQRVACYNLAELLLRENWPAASGIEHLRDLAPDKLKVQPADLYRALASLPAAPRRSQLRKLLPDHREQVDRILATHRDPGTYDLRGAALFGIGECLRSERYADLLERGDLETVRRWMQVSHDGDRVYQFDAKGKRHRFKVSTDDQALAELAEQNADPVDHPGRYACSTEAIDQLVDLAAATPGVIGAQLAGAGLGGCMMILAKAAALDRLLDTLKKRFYTPRKVPFDVHVCTPVAGAGLMSVKAR